MASRRRGQTLTTQIIEKILKPLRLSALVGETHTHVLFDQYKHELQRKIH